MLIGMVNPIPSLPPELLAMAVLMPITSPAQVQQRAAAVAGVDGRIGLEEILVTNSFDAQLQVAAAFGADDAVGHGVAQAEGAADGQHEIADLHGAAVAQLGRHDAWRVDGHDGDVGLQVGPHADGEDRPGRTRAEY